MSGKIPPSIPATTPAPVHGAPKGFAVSVGAFKEKANAIDLTSRLTGKGYPAQMALSKPKKLFRVTVGTYESRKEAAVMAAQIQKKEQLNTAIIDLGKP
jgi:cell division septation protein DedD